MISRMQYVVSTRVRSGLVHGLSWTGLAAPTTPWQRATVRNPTVLHDAGLWCMARQTVKLWDGNHYVVTELVSEPKGPAFRFHSMLACATVITMDEDRGAAYAFFMMSPLTFDGTRRTVTLASWLHDIEAIFRICHIQPHLQVALASRCLAVDARLWEGFPPKIREHVQPPMLEMTLDHMINDILDAELTAHVIQADAMINDQVQEPVDNAGIEGPHFQWDPELQEDPILAVPLQEIPPQEEGIDAEAMDLEEFPENLELQEDPPEIVMDEEEEEQVNVEDNPEEIIFDEEDWEVFSNVSSE
ncbi:hypothetical protein TIFTF001_049915 [Ficus carica]|uniref:Uncharacterized protein n=1 Tax=Ficus carica TaxID=3494 RepID=A0AA87YWK7_FICCA|nr:hypothetical protein TIFTF001_049915 [Ficus carica]